MEEKYRYNDARGYDDNGSYVPDNQHASSSGRPGGYDDADVFGHEENHDVRQHFRHSGSRPLTAPNRSNTRPCPGPSSPCS